MATFSKSLGSIGGMVAGPEDVIHYLKHPARSLIFSASNPPASVAATIAALEIIEQEPERRERLWRNTRRMQDGLRALGYDRGERSGILAHIDGTGAIEGAPGLDPAQADVRSRHRGHNVGCQPRLCNSSAGGTPWQTTFPNSGR